MGSAAVEFYNSAQRVYKSSVSSGVFTAGRCIAMKVVLRCTPSVVGTIGLPRKCTQPEGGVLGAPK